LKWLASGDRPAFFQLRTMLQGVVARGTARAIGQLSPYVGGKTGTSDDENDAWFVGFTNDVTVGVWVGYDNADGKRRTLGDGQTGGHVAVPIFEPIVEATWANYAPKTPLPPPSREAKSELVAIQIDLNSGNRLSARSTRGFTEYFRLHGGQADDTQYALVSQGEVASSGDGDDGEVVTRHSRGEYSRGYYQSNPGGGAYYQERPNNGFFQGGFFGDLFGQQQQVQRPVYPPGYGQPGTGVVGEARSRYYEERRGGSPRRVDPDVPFRDRQSGYW